ncbi:MAG: hypothetical protein EB117_12455 [Betaproteobacteria bacterium]|nr:hypothetical protein [Betaproteobacteria bacterium]
MAGSFSNFLENKLLDQIFGGVAYTFPASIYIGLATTVASDGSTFTEISGNNYARVAVTRNQTNFPAAVAGAVSNGTAITFPQASGSWGTIVAVGVFDASTAGNLLAWADLTVSKTIASGDTASFAVGDFDVTLD